jgi:hypothetical protein
MPVPLSIMLLDDDDQREALDRGTSFTTMTRAGSKIWPANQAALLVDLTCDEPPLITEIGSLTRSGQRIATGWHRLRYIRRTALSHPIAVDELLDALEQRPRGAVIHEQASLQTRRSATARPWIYAVTDDISSSQTRSSSPEKTTF